MNLYRVTLKGLTGTTSAGLSPAYVVAQDAEAAYQRVKAWADKRDYGFADERTLRQVELVATEFDEAWSPRFPAPLFLTPKEPRP